LLTHENIGAECAVSSMRACSLRFGMGWTDIALTVIRLLKELTDPSTMEDQERETEREMDLIRALVKRSFERLSDSSETALHLRWTIMASVF